jgi:hypothetical protein
VRDPGVRQLATAGEREPTTAGVRDPGVREPATAGERYRSALARRFGQQHRQFAALYPLVESRRVLDTVIRACQRDSSTFDRLLEVGLGDARFGVGDIPRFARGLRR